MSSASARAVRAASIIIGLLLATTASAQDGGEESDAGLSVTELRELEAMFATADAGTVAAAPENAVAEAPATPPQQSSFVGAIQSMNPDPLCQRSCRLGFVTGQWGRGNPGPLSNDYVVHITRFDVEFSEGRLVDLGDATGAAFDPASPPEGYSVCHNGPSPRAEHLADPAAAARTRAAGRRRIQRPTRFGSGQAAAHGEPRHHAARPRR